MNKKKKNKQKYVRDRDVSRVRPVHLTAASAVVYHASPRQPGKRSPPAVVVVNRDTGPDRRPPTARFRKSRGEKCRLGDSKALSPPLPTTTLPQSTLTRRSTKLSRRSTRLPAPRTIKGVTAAMDILYCYLFRRENVL